MQITYFKLLSTDSTIKITRYIGMIVFSTLGFNETVNYTYTSTCFSVKQKQCLLAYLYVYNHAKKSLENIELGYTSWLNTRFTGKTCWYNNNKNNFWNEFIKWNKNQLNNFEKYYLIPCQMIWLVICLQRKILLNIRLLFFCCCCFARQ